ncbi:MAG: phosphate ABC transporter permease PstA [Kofleriaceae bacterium]|nr:phosphate ABC transporter permease PstA [Kofleriaceae bacterium]
MLAHTTLAPDALRPQHNLRSVKNAIMTSLMIAAVIVVAIPLIAVIYSVITRGASIATTSFPDFFTKEIPVVSRRHGPGMGPAIVGTLLVTGGATFIAVPLGVLGAVFLHEYGQASRFARVVRFMATVMTGVPSIVMGLFVYLTWTMRFGYSAFGGALALACLMLPVVIGSTEQMLRLVPATLREAAYALGSTKSRAIVTVVLPAALPGIVSGALLAIARAAGETAPLLFAVGAAHRFNPDLFHEANTALSVQIFGNATSAFSAAQDRAWGAALTLMLVAFLITFVARVFTARFALKR